MRRFVLLSAALLVLPSLAAAQRGGRTRTGATSRTDMFSDNAPARRRITITSDKLRDLNPLHILIDKRGDMNLNDDQVNKLKAMNDELEGVDKASFHVLDSLNTQLRRLGSSTSPDDQSRAQTMSGFTRMIAGNTRQRYDSVETAARAVLTDDQQKKAEDVLQDAHEQLARLAGRDRNR